MIYKEQIDFFRDVYKEEEARYQSLTDRGKIYLSIVSVFFGGVFLKYDWILDHRPSLKDGLAFHALGIAAFLVSLMLICRALQVIDYAEIADLSDLVKTENLESQPLEEFYKLRMADYAAAYEVNFTQNDKWANLLKNSLDLIVVGVILILAGILQAFASSLGWI